MKSIATELIIIVTWIALEFFAWLNTVYLKKYAHGFCFAVLCCGYTLTDFPISIKLTSLALWQSNDCPSASKATLMNMDKCFMWIHYERLYNHNKAKHNKTVCIFPGIYCMKRKHMALLIPVTYMLMVFDILRPSKISANLTLTLSNHVRELLYPPYPKDRGMLWFYVEAARRPPPAARHPPPAMVLTR